jgi:phosphoribosylformylglycinamidine synthase
MEYHARVEVSLKTGYSDPAGETTKQSLVQLKYPVKSVSVSETYTICLEASSLTEAEKIVNKMCMRLLANPVKDNFRFEIEEKK